MLPCFHFSCMQQLYHKVIFKTLQVDNVRFFNSLCMTSIHVVFSMCSVKIARKSIKNISEVDLLSCFFSSLLFVFTVVFQTAFCYLTFIYLIGASKFWFFWRKLSFCNWDLFVPNSNIVGICTNTHTPSVGPIYQCNQSIRCNSSLHYCTSQEKFTV